MIFLAALKKIGTCRITSGKLRHGVLPVKAGYDIPISIMKGRKEGKTCFISGGMHGDEINGMKLVQMIMASLDPAKISGTIIFIPIVNLSGFNKKKYTVPEDNKDINRCFDKRCRSISYFIAKTLFKEVVEKCDFGIDCHDCGAKDVLLPHSRVHKGPDGDNADGSTIDLGRLFGTKVIMLRNGERGMLSHEASKKLKKPVLTVEVGGGLVFWNDFLKDALTGIKNILIHHGFISGKIKLPRDQYMLKDLDRFTYRVRREGLLYKNVELGDKVHKGDTIAEIHDPVTGRRKEIISRHCGFVFSLRMQDKVNKGDSIVSILQSNDCLIHGTKKQKDLILIRNYPNIWDFANNDKSYQKTDTL